jgi:hypothetical protein
LNSSQGAGSGTMLLPALEENFEKEAHAKWLKKLKRKGFIIWISMNLLVL